MDAWKVASLRRDTLTQKGQEPHREGSQFLASLSRRIQENPSGPSFEELKQQRIEAERVALLVQRASVLAPQIVAEFGDAYQGERDEKVLKGLVTVLSNEILTLCGNRDHEVWQPISLWIRLNNCAGDQGPLKNAGGIISLLRRCKRHGLQAVIPKKWANSPTYWSADEAPDRYEDWTSLATLRDRWIEELAELQAEGDHLTWSWSAEHFELSDRGSQTRELLEDASGLEELEVFWDDYNSGGRWVRIHFDDLGQLLRRTAQF